MKNPDESRHPEEDTHSGRLLLRMPPALHAALARAAEREATSLNQFITGALSAAVGWPDESRSGGPPTPAAGPPRSRFLAIALVANFVVVGVAAAVALAVLLSVWI